MITAEALRDRQSKKPAYYGRYMSCSSCNARILNEKRAFTANYSDGTQAALCEACGELEVELAVSGQQHTKDQDWLTAG